MNERTAISGKLKRRDFCGSLAAAGIALQSGKASAHPNSFSFRYLLGSCLYGYQYLGEILPEVKKTGAAAIDIWPKVHGNQREQIADLGEDKFASMLEKYDISLGCITQYKLGPFGLQDEMRFARRLGCETIVTGAKGPKGLAGDELKAGVASFVEAMKPHLEVASECGITIAIENHGNNLIESPDSIKWLAELSENMSLGIALAPYHLEQNPESLSQLIMDLGERISVFYAWQHGKGCMKKLPKKQELLQMPGRGDLDFKPIVEALRRIEFSGWTEIFMHPVPRGIPILETANAVTEEVNKARKYLESFLS